MGVPLRQLYGQTETLGAYTVHRPDDVNQDTVGVAFNDRIETRIDNPDPNGLGEIVTRHPNMFSGYYKLPENNDLRDGWLHTGDAGYFDKNGHLVVIDRVKDLATTSGGDRFSPQYIENKLKFSPYVAEAVVLGAGRPHLAAMICIRFPDRQQMGGAQPHRLHHLFRPRGPAAGAGPAARERSRRSTPPCRRRSSCGSSCCSTRSSTRMTRS
jgi:long-chain acyl-CoA synthetase